MKRKLLFLMVSGFLASSAYAEVENNSSSARDPGAEAQLSDPSLNKKVSLESGEVENLTPEELSLIERKGKAMFKYIYEQEQLRGLNDILEDGVRNEQIKEAKKERFPLNPEEVMEYRRMGESLEKAQNTPLSGPVDFKIKTIDIDVDAPKPLQILVARGYSSSIMFFDQTGAPWPIEGDIIGDKGSFISHTVKGKDHVGVFEIIKAFSESNALINLKDMNVPIVVRLTGSDKEIDSRISVRIPRFGPGANLNPFVRSELENSKPDMLTVLNGDKLAGGRLFELNGVPGTVWYKDQTLYIRTLANLMSPPWKSHMSSPTGYNVYEIPPVTNLLFAVDGEMRDATITKGVEVKMKQERSIFDDNGSN